MAVQGLVLKNVVLFLTLRHRAWAVLLSRNLPAAELPHPSFLIGPATHIAESSRLKVAVVQSLSPHVLVTHHSTGHTLH